MQIYVTTGHQFFAFVAMLWCGVIVAFVYDVFRLHRRYFAANEATIAWQDVIFWAIAFVLAFQFIGLANNGELRVYEFIAMLAGAAGYFVFLSKFAQKTCIYLARMFRKSAEIIIKIALVPIVFLYRALNKPVRALWRMVKNGANRAKMNRKRLGAFLKRV